MADEITTNSEDTGLHDNNFANVDSLYHFLRFERDIHE